MTMRGCVRLIGARSISLDWGACFTAILSLSIGVVDLCPGAGVKLKMMERPFYIAADANPSSCSAYRMVFALLLWGGSRYLLIGSGGLFLSLVISFMGLCVGRREGRKKG